MILGNCSHARELAQALKSGHWPHGCEPELRSHVANCRECGEVVLLTQVFREARSQSEKSSVRDAPELLWWRAQLRRRNAATEQAGRPIAVAQVFAFAISLLVAGVFVALEYRHGLRWSSWFADVVPSRMLHSLSQGFADWNVGLLIPTFAALVVLSGLVVYLVTEKS